MVNGGECQPGDYCPEGSVEPLLCTPGWYCDISGLATPVGECDAGWYCPWGSASQQQIDCPLGSYCVQGSDIPEPCRNGTYGDSTLLAAADECRLCDPGFYCNLTGAVAVSGECDPGMLISLVYHIFK